MNLADLLEQQLLHLPVQRRTPEQERRLSTPQGLIEHVDVADHVKGVWRDVYSRNGEVFEVTDWQHNLVVNIFANLVAALTMGDGAGGLGTTWKGVQYLAVGTSATAENAADTQLGAEVYRQLIGSAYFSTNTGALVSSGTSPNLTIATTIPAGAANFVLREFGLFGGNASPTANSGLMIDHITHGIIDKSVTGSGDFDLTRLVTLIF